MPPKRRASELADDPDSKIAALEARLQDVHTQICRQNNQAFATIASQILEINRLQTRINANGLALRSLENPAVYERVKEEEDKIFAQMTGAIPCAPNQANDNDAPNLPIQAPTVSLADQQPAVEGAKERRSKRLKRGSAVAESLDALKRVEISASQGPAYHELTEEELDDLASKPEPQRYYDWMRIMFVASQDGEIPQLVFWSLYRDAFSPFVDDHPLRSASDVITDVGEVFPKAKARKDTAEKFIVEGLERRREPVVPR